MIPVVYTTNISACTFTGSKCIIPEWKQIEETHTGQRYELAEAKEAFQCAMAIHGWA